MTKVCDNLSVGVLIRNRENKLLLIERKKFPFGFSPPAGHIDDFDSPEDCAKGEVSEEVGLMVTSLKLLYEGRQENKCRRKGGSHHYWCIYEAVTNGSTKAGFDEVKQIVWCDDSLLVELMKRTEEYRAGNITEEEWAISPGLEPVWYDIIKIL